mgnify:FL=1
MGHGVPEVVGCGPCLRVGNVSPENMAKGPESAIGQVRQYRGKFWQMVPDNIPGVSVVLGGGESEQLQLSKRELRRS